MSSLMMTMMTTRGDNSINEIRMLLAGSKCSWIKLFKQAVAEENTVLQIQLSHVRFGMIWGKDEKKDFSSLVVEDLEKFNYYPKNFMLFNLAYDEAMETKSTWDVRETQGFETFRSAANCGYLPAFLELKQHEWGINDTSYGFAVQLRPFVGKGDKNLDFCFGLALKGGCEIGSQLYYEGMYWMNQAHGFSVKYPKEDEDFDAFVREYLLFKNRSSVHYTQDGFEHVGGTVILAPSPEKWSAFLNEKLNNISITPPETYIFEYNPEQIKSLLNEYKIGAVITSSTKRDSFSSSKTITSIKRVNSISIYQDHKKIGIISVEVPRFEIYETFENLTLKPIIDFIENVMIRTGSPCSAFHWLRQMGGRYI